MSENNERIAKNALMLYIRMGIIMLVQLYISRIVLNTLGVSDYGIYNVVGGIVTMLGFLRGTIAAATQRFLSVELGKNDIPKLRTVFNTTMQIHIGISVVVLILAETIGIWLILTQMQIPQDRVTAAIWVFQFSIISTIAAIMSVPFNATIIAHEKMSSFAFISIFEAGLMLLTVYFVLISSVDRLILYGFLNCLIQIVLLYMYGFYCIKKFSECKYQKCFDRNLIAEILGFSGWNLFSNVAAVLSNQGVNIILNIYFGPVVNAARGLAYQVQGAANRFCVNFQMAVNPQMVKSYAAGDLGRTQSLMFRSSKFSYYLLFIIVLPLFLETNMILTIWLKNVPENTVLFLRILLGCILLWTTTGPLCTVANATGNIKKMNLICSFIVVLVVPFSWLSFIFGAPAYYAMMYILIFEIISSIARMIIVRELFPFSVIDFCKKVYGRIFVVTIFSASIPFTMKLFFSNSIFNSFIIIVSSMISVCLFSFMIGMTRNEQLFVINKIKGDRKNKIK